MGVYNQITTLHYKYKYITEVGQERTLLFYIPHRKYASKNFNLTTVQYEK